jgi:8-oxo-dGTP pyrophosphatase MutT (NUDIX family)
MHAGVSSTINRSQGQNPSTKFFRLAQLRKLRRCEQVAAICFRARGSGIEFLLVQTRKGRWIFPKGSAEPGLTHAQAAALEAFEEAGVHGRMEEASFARYVQRKRGHMRRATELAVSAHLCEVLRLVPPPELNRNPTWFSAEKAKRRLRDDRAPDYGADLSRVIDKAINRIQRLRSGLGTAPEAPFSTQPAGTQRKDAGQKARLIQIDCARGTTGRTKAASAG